jgi:predicted Zn-dependent protease with MMP-like domain
MSSIHTWPDLRRIAGEEVARLVRELPKSIRPLVEAVPVVFEKSPSQALLDDGVEPDVMGLFVGSDYAREAQDPLPPSIILFLEAIRDEAEGDSVRFRQEVRRTILHEIGHYLGLNEDDLFKRDLD